MFAVEAAWIHDRLQALDDTLSPILNIGSGNSYQREVRKPAPTAILFDPLAARGIEIIHCDIRDQPGVDIVADLTTDEGIAAAAARKPAVVLCNSVYEHLPNPRPLAASLCHIVRPGGYVVVTVPLSYPFHADPIDTMFRPTPGELVALHPGLDPIEAVEITASDYRTAVRLRPRRLLRDGVNSLHSVVRTRSMSNMYPWWWNQPYVMSAALLRRPDGD